MIDRSKFALALGLALSGTAAAAWAAGTARSAPPSPTPAAAAAASSANGGCCQKRSAATGHDHSKCAGDHAHCAHHRRTESAAATAAKPCPYRKAQENTAPPAARPAKAAYACPMHPEVTSAEKGRCPKCGMFLEKV